MAPADTDAGCRVSKGCPVLLRFEASETRFRQVAPLDRRSVDPFEGSCASTLSYPGVVWQVPAGLAVLSSASYV